MKVIERIVFFIIMTLIMITIIEEIVHDGDVLGIIFVIPIIAIIALLFLVSVILVVRNILRKIWKSTGEYIMHFARIKSRCFYMDMSKITICNFMGYSSGNYFFQNGRCSFSRFKEYEGTRRTRWVI